MELFPGSMAVDAEVFEQTARQALAHGVGYQAAAELYPGDLLPEDRYAAWAEQPRDRPRGLHLDLLRAAEQWQQVLAIEPADEPAPRGLMHRALDAGDRGAVVRQFELLRHRLRADLGVGPDRASITLYEKALAMSPGFPTQPSRDHSKPARARPRPAQLRPARRRSANRRASTIAGDRGTPGPRSRRGQRHPRNPGKHARRMARSVSRRLRGLGQTRTPVGPPSSSMRTPVWPSSACAARTATSSSPILRANYPHPPSSTGPFTARRPASCSPARSRCSPAGTTRPRTRLTSALHLYEQAGATSGKVLSMQRLAELAFAAGDRTRATHLLQTALPMARATWLQPHFVVRTNALLLEASDDPKEAVRHVAAADRQLEGTVCPPCSLGYHLAAAKAFARAGALQQAQRRLDDEERLAGMRPAGAAHGAVWEARAVLRDVRGDVERASAFWLEAANRFDEVGRPVDRDRCRAYATAL